VKKFRVSLALQPLATALFANSPFFEGKDSGFKSYRSHIWTDTDPDRCGMLPFVFEDGFGFERYADYMLDVPMYFVYRDGQYIDASGQSFKDYLQGKLPARPGELPTINDWADHITTAFPEVRLKQYLEMRGADTGPVSRLNALPALWTGILYDKAALAAAQRRAAEIDVRISAIQGEAAGLDSVVGEQAADLIICHSVLEYVDSPADALAAIARVLRPGGTVSVLASGVVAAVLHRALTGRFDEARALLERDRQGMPGEGPRWFTLPGLTALIEGAGLTPGAALGAEIFGGLVPSVLVDAEPGAAESLRALEAAAATYPALRDVAAKLHVLGRR